MEADSDRSPLQGCLPEWEVLEQWGKTSDLYCFSSTSLGGEWALYSQGPSWTFPSWDGEWKRKVLNQHLPSLLSSDAAGGAPVVDPRCQSCERKLCALELGGGSSHPRELPPKVCEWCRCTEEQGSDAGCALGAALSNLRCESKRKILKKTSQELWGCFSLPEA